MDLALNPHGSSGFADYAMRKDSGLYGKQGAYVGTDDAGRHCHSDQQSAIALIGGARSGKGNFTVPFHVDGCLTENGEAQHIISLDWKNQNGPIAAQQVRQGRHIYAYNPRGHPNAPYSRMNPHSHLTGDSKTLVADAQLDSASWIPFTDPHAQFFEGMAQKVNTAAQVTMARLEGVVTLPTLADKMAGFGGVTEEWLAFEYEMSQQPEPEIRKVASDLQRLRESNSDSGGWEGIKSQLEIPYAALADPQVRAALSPPYDFDFSWLTDDDAPPAMVSIAEDLEYAEIASPILRSLLTSAFIRKRRAPTARAQFWCLDEAPAMGAWPLGVKLATIGAGYRIRAAYVSQSSRQLDALGPHAGEVIINSCGTAIYLGVRSSQQASLLTSQLGKVTLEYDDRARQEAARAASSKALLDTALNGADPITSLMTAAHQDRMAEHRSKMARDLRSVDEVINEKNDRAYVFMPGVLERPFYANVPKYWRRRDLAGRYLGDPFHAKPGTVEIATIWGQRHRKVVTADCPRHLRDWPQYRESGRWSYVKGFKP